ncbi:PLC-like phosphodiesterase [Lecanosticta acicola]|uniref:PLC-like phosphodiesterase n=1 Tax=Lecanosticta acicola TaxID=111012 RepID=A0AAI9EFV6_9PEZI|nr:PLC-like phosphodiesterase [Lecanosticta acicola]
MLAATFIILTAVWSWTSPTVALFGPAHGQPGDVTEISLADLALSKVLQDASPIFGNSPSNDTWTARWMAAYSDDTLLVHMNLPGTHDAATWNYSKATQQSLKPVTDLRNLSESDPSFYRCQASSMFDMLAAGIRVFDLRYAYDVTRTTLVFWHGNALQSETATVDDVMFAFYHWLDSHRTEALFLSFQHEGSNDDRATELMLYNTLTSPAAQSHVVQEHGALGTLGEARGKITLLRRFDLHLLPTSYEKSMPGLHFSPQNWTDNGPNITLVYNTTSHATAYIEDYYQPLTPHGSKAEENIRWKLNATESHLRMAANSHPDSLFWTFASSTNTGNHPPDTPIIQALGDGDSNGVNQQLVPFLKLMQGKRLGILMFDFFEEPADLLSLYLSLLPPDQARNYGS